jgi:3-oxoacyl-[acyl-carrier-protein] synthase-3
MNARSYIIGSMLSPGGLPMAARPSVGIVGYGLYVPETFMTAAEVAAATKGNWTEQAVREKLGFDRKPIPGPGDGTQEMGAKAGLDCLERTGYDPKKLDVILCIGEEWK